MAFRHQWCLWRLIVISVPHVISVPPIICQQCEFQFLLLKKKIAIRGFLFAISVTINPHVHVIFHKSYLKTTLNYLKKATQNKKEITKAIMHFHNNFYFYL